MTARHWFVADSHGWLYLPFPWYPHDPGGFVVMMMCTYGPMATRMASAASIFWTPLSVLLSYSASFRVPTYATNTMFLWTLLTFFGEIEKNKN